MVLEHHYDLHFCHQFSSESQFSAIFLYRVFFSSLVSLPIHVLVPCLNYDPHPCLNSTDLRPYQSPPTLLVTATLLSFDKSVPMSFSFSLQIHALTQIPRHLCLLPDTFVPAPHINCTTRMIS